MSIDACIAIVWDVLKMGFAPIKRGFGYVMSSESYADNLRQEIGKLDEQVVRVGHIAEGARNNCRDLCTSFTRWEDDAKRNSGDAQRLLDAFNGATKTCCYGRLRDPKCRYQFSTKAKAQIKVVRGLAQQCADQFKDLNNISSTGPAPGKVTVPKPPRRVQSPTPSTPIKPREDGLFESRALMILKVMDALANTSNSVVGIYGMGGVGKSTLLEDAEKRIRENKSFDWVAKADVSQNPDIKKIQKEIARCLGLSDLDKEEDVSTRAKLLHKRLEKEEREKTKVLIILDNLWERLDLKTVGIPCEPGNKPIGCKLLLTSRDQHILLREMRCESDSAFLLDELEKEEAKRLFEKMVGGKVPVELEPLEEKALHICAGLPFLIVAISKLFINSTYSDCDDALKQIWNEETGKVITNTLQLSYGQLSDEAKSLLRLCVAYGVSKPYLEDLARYSFGLGIFREVNSMQEGRARLRRLIHDLQATSLLLDGDEDADGFKIHDLVREFVASFASTDRPLLVLKNKDKWETELSEDKLKSCEAICFPWVNLEELPEELVCPELLIFFLFSDNESFEVQDSYFNFMKNLMALDLTKIHLSCSPSPFQFLENLHTLCLDYCLLEDVAILGELKGLQILSLRGSNIQRLPKEIGQLVELILLDLSRCLGLKIIEPGVLESLTKLEELYMGYSFDQWSAVELTPATNACLIELNNMKKLRTLHVSIHNSSVIPEGLNFQQLTNYRIRIGIEQLILLARSKREYEREYKHKYQGSTILELINLNPTSDILPKGCIQSILCKTDDLFLKGFNGTEQSIWALSPEGFPQLKHLQVQHSPSIRYILEWFSLPAFKALETLLLENMINLEKITSKNISSESFSSLRVARVKSCDKMEVLFPRSVVRELRQLEEIQVEGCELMRGIIEADDDRGKFELPKLRVLELRNLPIIENFVTAGSSPLSSTSNDQLGPQIAFFNGQQAAFPKLESLDIAGCHNVGFMFFPSMVKSLAQLRKLIISDCQKMEAIIMEEEGSRMEMSETLEFPMLTDLYLQNLNSLMCFSHGSQETRSQDHVESCSTVLFNQKVSFPFLESLKIERLPNLKEIWSDESPLELSNLQSLEVVRCHGLSNMFTPTMATNLVGLTQLRISKCELLTEIICDERGREGHVVAFNQLECIELVGLVVLRCFYSGGYTLMLPLLEEVIVTECPKMKFFSKGAIEVSKLQRVKISWKEWLWKGDLNITIQHMFEEMVATVGVKHMLLSEFPELIGKWNSGLNPIKSSWQLESLTVDKCPSFINAIPSRLMLVLEKTEMLQVRDCELLEEIFDLEGLEIVESTRVLPSLRTLDLFNLPKLRRLWNKDLQGSMSYNFLNYVTLYKCSNLTHAFVPSMARCLANLENMEIKECDQMEGVIAKEEWQGSAAEKILFSKLKLLKLECLPNLTSFLLGKNHTLECPKLKVLTIAHCPQMRNLAWQSLMEIDNGTPSLFTPQVQFPQLKSIVLTHMDNLSKIWTNDPQETLTFDYLEEVDAQNCKSLEILFPHWVAPSLTQLEKLRVESCGIEEIVANGDDVLRSTTTQVLFPKLSSLVLHDMPRLESLFPNLPTLSWPFLEELRVTHCDKVNMLSFAASMNKWTWRDDQHGFLDQEEHSTFEKDFSKLERLLLDDKDIRMIQDGKYPNNIFGKPKALTLACFHEENAIFPSRFLLERFQNLESLEIFCSSFEDIFPNKGLVDEGKHSVLESLKELKLSKLHKLKRVWRKDCLVSKILQSIETLQVWDCPGLTTLFPIVTSFRNLTQLVVKNSSGLVHLATASTITSLVNLTYMTIIGCERMKEVVAKDENEEGKVISFEKLWWLRLQNMPSLECFSSTTSCILRFPSLYYIKVKECPKMKIFCKGPLSTPELSFASLFRYKWKYNWEGDLNRTVQKLSA